MQSFIMRNDLFRGNYNSKPVLQCAEGSILLLVASTCGRYFAQLLISVSWKFLFCLLIMLKLIQLATFFDKSFAFIRFQVIIEFSC